MPKGDRPDPGDPQPVIWARMLELEAELASRKTMAASRLEALERCNALSKERAEVRDAALAQAESLKAELSEARTELDYWREQTTRWQRRANAALKEEHERLWERLTTIVEESFGWQLPASRDELLTVLEHEIHEMRKTLLNDLTQAEARNAKVEAEIDRVVVVIVGLEQGAREVDKQAQPSHYQKGMRDAWETTAKRLRAALARDLEFEEVEP